MSKFRKWNLREPKFAKFPGGACPQSPLEARAFGANNYSLFSITWGWNLCGWSPRTSLFGGSLYRGFNIFVIMTSCSTALTSSSICSLFKTMERLDCKKVRIFAYSSKREQSSKRSGTGMKTESETGERLFFSRLTRFARVRLLRHALPISWVILRKKPRLFCSLRKGTFIKSPMNKTLCK